MDIKALKASILSNTIPRFLIFIEEEPALADQYKHKISETLDMQLVMYDSADSAIYDSTTNIGNDVIYVVYNDVNILKHTEYIDNMKNMSGRFIVCFPSNVSGVGSVVNKFSENTVVFSRLDEYSLLAYATKSCNDHKVSIEQKWLIELVKSCDCRLGVLMNELDKIFTLNQKDSTQLTKYILSHGFPDYRSINLFQFIDRVLAKDEECLSKYRFVKDSPVTVAYNMFNSARRKLEATRNPVYGKIMQTCHDVYNSVVDGSMSEESAMKYMILSVYGE